MLAFEFAFLLVCWPLLLKKDTVVSRATGAEHLSNRIIYFNVINEIEPKVTFSWRFLRDSGAAREPLIRSNLFHYSGIDSHNIYISMRRFAAFWRSFKGTRNKNFKLTHQIKVTWLVLKHKLPLNSSSETNYHNSYIFQTIFSLALRIQKQNVNQRLKVRPKVVANYCVNTGLRTDYRF